MHWLALSLCIDLISSFIPVGVRSQYGFPMGGERVLLMFVISELCSLDY